MRRRRGAGSCQLLPGGPGGCEEEEKKEEDAEPARSSGQGIPQRGEAGALPALPPAAGDLLPCSGPPRAGPRERRLPPTSLILALRWRTAGSAGSCPAAPTGGRKGRWGSPEAAGSFLPLSLIHI